MFEVEVFENQRYAPIVGWSFRLPTDRPEWSSRVGEARTRASLDAQLPALCRWTSEWRIHIADGVTDCDGWQYAADFPSKNYHDHAKAFESNVRRRSWRRVGEQMPAPDGSFANLQRTFGDALIASTVGGDGDADTDDEFDDLDEREVRRVLQAHSLGTDPDAMRHVASLPTFEDPKTATKCNNCSAAFSLVSRKKTCLKCGACCCKKCIIKSPTFHNAMVCRACERLELARADEERRVFVKEHRERKMSMRATRAAAFSTAALEEQLRKAICESEASEFAHIMHDMTRKVQIVAELARANAELEKTLAADAVARTRRDELMDRFASAERRSANVKLVVARAVGVPAVPAGRALRVTVLPSGRSDGTAAPEIVSEHYPCAAECDFNFDAFFSVVDDHVPITITVEAVPVRQGVLSVLDAATLVLMRATLDLRAPYPNLMRDVTPNFVYVERGNAVLDCVDYRGAPMNAESVNINVRWLLEAREEHVTEFCATCGRVVARCDCSAEVRAERDRRAREAAEEQRVKIFEAAMKRREEEQRQRERHAAQERLRAHAANAAAFQQVDVGERAARAALLEQEAQEFFLLADQERERHADVTGREVRRLGVVGHLRSLSRLKFDANASLMSRHYFAWMSVARSRANERRAKTASDAARRRAASVLLAHELARADAEKEQLERQLVEAQQRLQTVHAPVTNDSRVVLADGTAAAPVHYHAQSPAAAAPKAKEDNKACCAMM